MPEPDPAAVVDDYLASLDATTRRVAPGQWGLEVEAAGWPLHVGLALRRGLLRAQAEVVGPDQLSDHELLHRNRTLAIVRLAHTADGTVWVQGDLPPAAVSAQELDRLLGLLVAAATEVRQAASASAADRARSR